ncbi:unnamed protein product [Leptidea sinapis]|uniref:Uncharacterized protein n=1 Tax=Leptidea sinapis TaxID=189913 RepID=A0A5E4QLK5_9NEOP|nr:unnamed protein product [Leptidea sinapis]VVC98922.1 unnamed protein product [Leptidea sinapis]
MHIVANKNYLFAVCFTLLRPLFALNMSSGSVDADIYSVAYVTVPSTNAGKKIGYAVVKHKLAACVNIIPQVTSIYEWENEINEDSEALLIIKTRTSLVDKLTTFVRAIHPYKVCEVISFPIKNGNPPYLKWIGETLPNVD